MPDIIEHKHITVNGRYEVTLERAASTKGVVGVKVKACGDDKQATLNDALDQFNAAVTQFPAPAVEK